MKGLPVTEYFHVLQEAWSKLIHDFNIGIFTPEEEADIQCYLYHLCLRKLGDPNKIHAEWRNANGRFLDLMLGSEKLPVEIKWSYIRKRRKPSQGWSSDIKKLSKEFSSRKPAFALFLSDSNCSPIEAQELTPAQMKSLLRIKQIASRYGVNLLLSFQVS